LDDSAEVGRPFGIADALPDPKATAPKAAAAAKARLSLRMDSSPPHVERKVLSRMFGWNRGRATGASTQILVIFLINIFSQKS
jgi:hypothetical protein